MNESSIKIDDSYTSLRCEDCRITEDRQNVKKRLVWDKDNEKLINRILCDLCQKLWLKVQNDEIVPIKRDELLKEKRKILRKRNRELRQKRKKNHPKQNKRYCKFCDQWMTKRWMAEHIETSKHRKAFLIDIDNAIQINKKIKKKNK